MKEGDTVYSERGVQGRIHTVLPNDRYLVAPTILVDTGEYGEQEGEGPWEIWSKVYAKPPIEKYDEQITQKTEQLNSLHAQITAARQEFHAFQQEEKERKERIKRHSQLERLDDFIQGKITHYVVKEYTGVRIMTAPARISEGRHGEDPQKLPLRLLTLYGDSKGDLQWRLNHYSSPSYTETDVYPFTDEASAKAKAKELCDVDAEKSVHKWTLESYQACGIEPPEGYAEKLAALERANLDARKKKLEEELAALK